MITKENWMKWSIIGIIVIFPFGIFGQIIDFNNSMISIQEMKKVEMETTKVEYGMCVVKIMETNQIAKAYRDDVMKLADKAGDNLEQLNQSLFALIGTQIIPQLSPELRIVVQKEIISCRNSYIGRVDLGLKPMYLNFNRMQRQFPNNIYNSMFFDWKTEDLIMPKSESAEQDFNSGKVKTLDLN